MQADRIVKKILDDATTKASEILDDAKAKSEIVLKDAEDFYKFKEQETLQMVEEFRLKTKEKYETLLKIEKNKLLLKYKQKALNDIKNNAINFFSNLNHDESLKLVRNLIEKYAEQNEKLLFCLKNVEKNDIEKLEIVKRLNLQVEKASFDCDGIILSGKTCDKNLLFEALIEENYNNSEIEINKLIF